MHNMRDCVWVRSGIFADGLLQLGPSDWKFVNFHTELSLYTSPSDRGWGRAEAFHVTVTCDLVSSYQDLEILEAQEDKPAHFASLVQSSNRDCKYYCSLYVYICLSTCPCSALLLPPILCCTPRRRPKFAVDWQT